MREIDKLEADFSEMVERSEDVVENKGSAARREGPAGRLRPGDAPPERLSLSPAIAAGARRNSLRILGFTDAAGANVIFRSVIIIVFTIFRPASSRNSSPTLWV